MDNFNKLPKMQCFKEGGSVQKKIANYEKRERKTEEKSDMVQDKAIVKKAIGMHDKQEHPGEKTDLSKLRKGGRAKKENGTVKKFEKANAHAVPTTEEYRFSQLSIWRGVSDRPPHFGINIGAGCKLF